MKFRYIEEPSILFGGDNQHICPKAGIYSYHPFDLEQVRPEKITLGIVGKSESIEQVLQWLESCKTHIAEKKSKNPHPKLFPNFCGFNKEIGFKCEIEYDHNYLRKLNNSDFDDIIRNNENLEDRITEIAQLFLNEIKFLSKNKKPDVILCVLSEQFITHIQKEELEQEGDETEDELDEKEAIAVKKEDDLDEEEISEKENNFRSYLKAKAMQHNVPIQIVRDRIAHPTSDMQDEATIAWNFFTALYYKAGGTSWAMIRRDVSENTCYAGISFFKSRDRETTQTSIAQIFNEIGKGVILRGEEVTLKKDDRIPHLTDAQAFNLLDLSLKEYYDAVKSYPKRLVIHKTSNFNQDEIHGFRQAAKKNHIHQLDLVSIQHSDIRLYRHGAYPPMRGTHMNITDKHHVLYTRGSVPYYETYTGKYIPSPIEIKLADYDESPNVICDEIMALTKMNWNNTQFDRKYPITIECARNVGKILKYLEEGDAMQLKYSFYM